MPEQGPRRWAAIDPEVIPEVTPEVTGDGIGELAAREPSLAA
jgi:hypothetical protein